MKTMKRFLSVLLALSMVISMLVIPAAAEGTPNVSFTVDETTVKEGETVTVVIENSQYEVNGFGCYLEFDKDLLECTSVTGADGDEYFFGMYYTAGTNTRYVEALVADTVEEVNSDGIFSFGGGTKNNTLYNAGIVATLVFTAKQAGTVEFKLTEDSSGTDAYKGEAQTETVKINKAPITEVTVSGLVEPETNAKPVEASELDVDPDSLNVKLKWFVGENTETKFVGEKFAPSTVYTAKITLEVKDGSGDNFADTVTVKGDDYDTVTRESDEKVVLTKTFKDGTAALPVPTADLFVMTIPAGLDLEYNGEDKWVEVEVADGVEGMGKITAIKYEGKDTGKVEVGERPTDSDTYIVSIDVAQGDEYAAINDLVINDGSDEDTRFRIKKRNADLKWTEDPNLVYDGTSKGVTVAIENLVDEDDVDVTVENAKNVDAGTYTAVATGLTGASAHNYRLPKKDGELDLSKIQYPYEITQATYDDDISGAVTVSNKGVTGKAVQVSVLSLPEGFENAKFVSNSAEVTEDDDDMISSVSVNANGEIVLTTVACDAETEATITAKVSSKNYEDKEVTITVTAKAVDVTSALKDVEIADSAVYGVTIEDLIENLPKGTVNAKDGEGKDLPGTLSVVNPTDIPDVGTATVTVRFTVSDTNSPYYAVVDTPYSVTITQKPLAVTWTDTKLTYNGEAQTANPYFDDNSGLLNDDDVGLLRDNFNDNVNVGEYTIFVELSGSDAANYVIKEGTDSCKYNIVPKEIAAVWSTDPLTYNGDSQAPTATAATGVDGETVTLTVSGGKTFGEGTAIAEIKAVTGGQAKASNYELTNKTKAFEIGKLNVQVKTAVAAVEGAVGVLGSAMKTTSEITAASTAGWKALGLPTELEIIYPQGATIPEGAPDSIEILGWQARKYDSTKLSDLFTVLKGIKPDQAGNASKAVLVVNGTQGTPEWMNVTTFPLNYLLTVTSKYEVEVTLETAPNSFTYGETLTYGTSEAAVPTVTQTEKEHGTVDAPTYIYTFTGKTAANKDYTSTGSIDEVVAPTEAGTYTLTVELNSQTHVGSDSESFTIAPKEVAVDWTNTELTYNAGTQAPTAAATGVSSETLTLSVSGGQKNANAEGSSYTATATLSKVTGGKASVKNYTLTNSTQAYTIEPAPLTLDDIADMVLVGSSKKYPIATVVDGLKSSKDTVKYTYAITSGDCVALDKANVKATKNGVAEITVTAAAGSNYKADTKTFQVTAVVNPFGEIIVTGGSGMTAKVVGDKIVVRGSTTYIAGLEYDFTDKADGFESLIGLAVKEGNKVTVPVGSESLKFTIDTDNVKEIDVIINEGSKETSGNAGADKIEGVIGEGGSNLPEEVVGVIAKAASEKNMLEVTVNVKTTVEKDEETGEITISATYEVTNLQDDAGQNLTGEITFVETPITVKVPAPDGAAEGEPVFVKTTTAKGAASYKTVKVVASKVAFETENFTETHQIIVPQPITVKFSYESDEPGNATETYNVGNIGNPLPVDEKSGFIFMGWDINGKAYKTVSEILWDIDLSEPLTAIFEEEGSDSDPTYIIKMNVTGDGSIKVNTRTPEADEEIVITVNPDNDCYLEELTVIDADGDELDLDKKGSKYYFDMPACTVTIKAVFSEGEKENGFSDVAENAYYFDAVEWAVEEEITTGYANGTFLPNATCTRAQTVTFLWRAMGEPKVKNAEMPFTDVAPDAYYYDAVLWAVENGITSGVSETSFAPNKTVTRAQTVTFLWRTAKMEGYDVSIGEETNILSYNDAETIGSYAIPAMQWACGEGIMGGYSDGTLRPNAGCTRAQIVTFLYRFLAD